MYKQLRSSYVFTTDFDRIITYLQTVFCFTGEDVNISTATNTSWYQSYQGH